MILYPAIDLKDKQCVRLFKGQMDKATVFNQNPTNQAQAFEKEGCEWIHLVDLNGAVEGTLINKRVVEKILKTVTIPIQLGGGIRNLQAIEEWLDSGVSRVIVGTLAIENLNVVKEAAKKFCGRIAVSIDAKNGLVSINGWKKTTSIRALDLAKSLESVGVCAIIYTDIERDGAMSGPNINATKTIANAVSIPVIASGGISSIKDLSILKSSVPNLNGVISGRAIYDQALDITEAINCLRTKDA